VSAASKIKVQAAAASEPAPQPEPVRREFAVLETLNLDNVVFEPGGEVSPLLTRAQFVRLRELGIVAGEWPEDKPAAQT
jgi:hypothetical protein